MSCVFICEIGQFSLSRSKMSLNRFLFSIYIFIYLTHSVSHCSELGIARKKILLPSFGQRFSTDLRVPGGLDIPLFALVSLVLDTMRTQSKYWLEGNKLNDCFILIHTPISHCHFPWCYINDMINFDE